MGFYPELDHLSLDQLIDRFHGPPPDGQFLPSDTAPIQKFLWWDAQIDTAE